MVMSGQDCYALPKEGDVVQFRGVFNLDATSAIVGKPLSTLKSAEYLQIRFFPMKPKQRVIGGHVIVIVNNAIKFEFQIPAQDMTGELIRSPDSGDHPLCRAKFLC